jgi:hypothetical protein
MAVELQKISDLWPVVAKATGPLHKGKAGSTIIAVISEDALEGSKDEKGFSIPLPADFLMRLDWLVCYLPQLSKVDFNSVKGKGKICLPLTIGLSFTQMN